MDRHLNNNILYGDKTIDGTICIIGEQGSGKTTLFNKLFRIGGDVE
jgi:ABC-type cobalamin/Fe3+-siderophores transport system ATPase subunit